MLTERDLLETIEECRAAKPTASTCQLMASCYTILDHLFPDTSHSVAPPVQMYSMASAPSDSEFVQAAMEAGIDRTLEVLDEHMECIRAIYPKEYAAIMRMLRD